MKNVLIVDDKEMMRDSVATTLERAGFRVQMVADGTAAIEQIAKARPDCVVTDMRMPGLSGLELLEKVRTIDDDLPVILMTAFGTIDTAVKAMKLGAFDYLTKPFEGDELVIAVKRAVEHRRLVRENAVLRVNAGLTPTINAIPGRAKPIGPGQEGSLNRTGVDRLVGSSQAITRLREQIRLVAGSSGTVLITGESGVGKEVVARAIHESSQRGTHSFLAVNCAALSTSLLESELFGHERGAFTGAEKLRKGRFELADNGSLLLDEVSEVAPAIQAKLLRVLQERAFERVGSSLSIGVDVRVIATSNRDLPASCAKGDFRQDLYFRLNVLPISIPPLRERAEDVPDLAKHFIAEFCAREGRTAPAVDSSAMELMMQYRWPGNVRELQNICERAVVLAGLGESGQTRTISRELVAPWLSFTAQNMQPAQAQPALNMQAHSQLEAKNSGLQSVLSTISAMTEGGSVRQLEDIERDAIVQTLVRFKGHRQKTAHALGIGVRTLGLKLKKWKQGGLVAETL
jgi:DNA-binding NtrC family response regulator